MNAYIYNVWRDDKDKEHGYREAVVADDGDHADSKMRDEANRVQEVTGVKIHYEVKEILTVVI